MFLETIFAGFKTILLNSVLYYFFRCSVFLVEHETRELVAKVFDGDVRKNSAGEEIQTVSQSGLSTQVTWSMQCMLGDHVTSA